MATDIYCPLDCKNRLESGLCELTVIALEELVMTDGPRCEDFKEPSLDPRLRQNAKERRVDRQRYAVKEGK